MSNISVPPQFQGPSRSQDPYAGGVFTKHGWFSFGELDANEVRYTKDRNGRRVLQFPFSREVSGRPMYREIPGHVMREQDAHAEESDRAAD